MTDSAEAILQASAARPEISISKQDITSYRCAAAELNRIGTYVLCVQHEYGIFGGPDGEMLLELLKRVEAPIVVTLHTVLDRPSPNQRRVMDAIIGYATRLVVMTDYSAQIMRELHGVSEERLRVVPHGIPRIPGDERMAQHRMAVGTCPILLTFGLLSPGKGIEYAIRALPMIVPLYPDLCYIVLGVTHPNLVREKGEAYRTSLQSLAAQLGVQRNVRFVDRFLELPELATALDTVDIYLTPYLNEAQSVSGTLAYSYGLGIPVVSTPYRHAVELLADGRGCLVPFADPRAIANAVTELLADPARLARMREEARLAGQEMVWPRIGARYLNIFQGMVGVRTSRCS